MDPNYLHWNLPSGRALLLLDAPDLGFPPRSPLIAKVRFDTAESDSKLAEWCECMVLDSEQVRNGKTEIIRQLAVIVPRSLNFVKRPNVQVSIILDEVKVNLKENDISKINFNFGGH
jgi:hypothetical protein